MSKKNDEDKNPRSRLSRYLRWFSVSKKKDISGLIIVEFERKTKLFNEKLFTDSHAQGLFNLNEQGVL